MVEKEPKTINVLEFWPLKTFSRVWKKFSISRSRWYWGLKFWSWPCKEKYNRVAHLPTGRSSSHSLVSASHPAAETKAERSNLHQIRATLPDIVHRQCQSQYTNLDREVCPSLFCGLRKLFWIFDMRSDNTFCGQEQEIPVHTVLSIPTKNEPMTSDFMPLVDSSSIRMLTKQTKIDTMPEKVGWHASKDDR